MRVIVSDGTAVEVIVFVREGKMVGDGVSVSIIGVSVKNSVADDVDIGARVGVGVDSFEEIKGNKVGKATMIAAMAVMIAAVICELRAFPSLKMAVKREFVSTFVLFSLVLVPFIEISSLSMMSS